MKRLLTILPILAAIPVLAGTYVAEVEKGPLEIKHADVLEINGSRLKLETDDPQAVLNDNDHIVNIETNFTVQAPDPSIMRSKSIDAESEQITPWGLQHMWHDVTENMTVPDDLLIVVMDTGYDYTHPDLPMPWANPEEVNGVDGRDDDGNGVIDDKYGYDVADDDVDVTNDTRQHGTHVGGTIAALDNDIGIKGVVPGARILPVKIFGDTGGASLWVILDGFDYIRRTAQHYDLRVAVNASWGSTSHRDSMETYISQLPGTLIGAAGNSGVDFDENPHYPAGYDLPNVIAVGAVDSNIKDAYFSNYGTNVFVVAPGVSVPSTVPGGDYESWHGTSMAAPHVTGAYAYMVEDTLEATFENMLNHAFYPGRLRLILDSPFLTFGKQAEGEGPGQDPER